MRDDTRETLVSVLTLAVLILAGLFKKRDKDLI